MIEEIRKPIAGFDGYEITNHGQVISSYINRPKKLRYDKDGYLTVNLWIDGKSHYRRVHRLVAEAFVPNPNNLPIVNHINEIKDCNEVWNLEWCDVAYNNNYSKAIPVLQIAPDGEVVRRFPSGRAAADEYGIALSHVNSCCRGYGHTVTYKGYKWIYEKDFDPNKDYSFVRNSKCTICDA